MMVPAMKKQEEENDSKKFVRTCWSSILMSNNNKSMEEETLMNSLNCIPPYYVAKTKKASLSDKSLQICTESLGSETGSDHLLFSSSSSYTVPSCVQTQFQAQTQALPEQHCANNLVFINKCAPRSPPSSLPPPLPSLGTLSRRRDGNGRLFLEALPAVAAASHKNINKNNNKLCAQRQDGRLVLTFAASKEEEEEEEEEEEFEEDDNVVVDEEEEYDEDDEVEEANHDDDDDDDDDGYLVHHHNNNNPKSIISCKDSRRSFLLWEPHCIAT
ncbi:protein FAF-like, chloroplastic [Arachis stenosperma]|uniref:protein FAF-like, chloroplastic n=1 Tax=Arachis stenosperma TaxID=217475 RepID=UPI0025AD70C7|nr:protein FAF-like, chloroplastic [Arachis stenosperma]